MLKTEYVVPLFIYFSIDSNIGVFFLNRLYTVLYDYDTSLF